MKVHLQPKKDYWNKMVKLSDRIRANSEAAPWVIEEVKKLEEKLSKCNDIRKAALEVAAENIRGGTNEPR